MVFNPAAPAAEPIAIDLIPAEVIELPMATTAVGGVSPVIFTPLPIATVPSPAAEAVFPSATE